jgi:hypothetical protein
MKMEKIELPEFTSRLIRGISLRRGSRSSAAP